MSSCLDPFEPDSGCSIFSSAFHSKFYFFLHSHQNNPSSFFFAFNSFVVIFIFAIFLLPKIFHRFCFAREVQTTADLVIVVFQKFYSWIPLAAENYASYGAELMNGSRHCTDRRLSARPSLCFIVAPLEGFQLRCNRKFLPITNILEFAVAAVSNETVDYDLPDILWLWRRWKVNGQKKSTR